jgi:hypothetical protein
MKENKARENTMMTEPIEHREGDTIPRPLGGEIYHSYSDNNGNAVVLTFNDLWALIVCRHTQDGDWVRTREAAGMVPDPARKQAVIERLWKLEQTLDGLPTIPDNVLKMHLHRAHVWFNQRPVSDARNW